jgi:hypothetical protein
MALTKTTLGDFKATKEGAYDTLGYDSNNNYAPVYVKGGFYTPGISATAKPAAAPTPTPTPSPTPTPTPGPTPTPTPAPAAPSPATGIFDYSGLNIPDFVPYTQTAQGKQDYGSLQELTRVSGILTPEEQADIEQQANSSVGNYDNLITDAQEEKRLGMPKALVNGGQAGGLENTQVAGAAAVAQTNGGTWEGAGGKLDQFKSAYDRNISNLKVQRQQALDRARAELRAAKLDGKQVNLENARKLFDLAKSSHNDAIDMIDKKVTTLGKLQTMSDKNTDTTLKQLQMYGESGVEAPQVVKDAVDAQFGEGFSEKYVAAAQKTKGIKDAKDAADAAKEIADLLYKVPAGQSINIGGATYTGMKPLFDKSDVFTTTETDRSGRTTQVYTRVNPATGKPEILGSVDLGRIGKGVEGDTGGTPTEISSILEAVSQNLLTNYKGADKFVNTEKYKEAYQEFATKYPKYAKNFTDYLPPAAYLNPKDDFSKQLGLKS